MYFIVSLNEQKNKKEQKVNDMSTIKDSQDRGRKTFIMKMAH